ncbi:hypothetical protein ACFW9N_19780 [Streptomyces sp. NPDC059496]|uniref:hypothetical protein n=1 Tax=Streptomyces sp. NPDC059496 TaxID=3346851 RepID=UPI00369AC5DD
MTTTKALRVSQLPDAVRREAFAEASRFRSEFYECLIARCDHVMQVIPHVPQCRVLRGSHEPAALLTVGGTVKDATQGLLPVVDPQPLPDRLVAAHLVADGQQI